VSIRLRIFLAFFAAGVAGLWYMADWVRDDVRPHYLKSMEESLGDTANVLSSLLSDRVRDGTIETAEFRRSFDEACRRQLSAKIYDMVKTRVDLRVYVTDERGVVIFDSDGGRDEGKDYSRWNDVYLTLRGEYGARSTRGAPDAPRTSVRHIAAPVLADGRTVGVLTVCKPVDSVDLFIESARRRVVIGALAAGLVVLVLSYAISRWGTRPIRRLTEYAKAVRDGGRPRPPAPGRSEIGTMGAALEEMREALEGRKYVETFVQTLTHEVKSPLSAIRGAAELLEEEMPAERRARFIANIRGEAERIQKVVDRLLELSSLESRGELRDVEEVDLSALIEEVVESISPALESRNISLRSEVRASATVRGERFLLRQALANLLQNAADFSPRGGEIAVALEASGSVAEMSVVDRGPGIPEYAGDRIFEKFYSLPRPETGRKGTGLGLSFVRQVAALHGGEAGLENRPGGGARAFLRLPCAPLPATA